MAQTHELEIVKQCIEMIEQEALGLMDDGPAAESGACNLDKTLGLLRPIIGAPESTQKDAQESPDIKEKLAMLATGIQLLSDRIQQKSQQLVSGEPSFCGADSNATTALPPSRQNLLVPDSTSMTSVPSDGVKSHLYTDALERLTESHADLKCRMVLLEAENRRLQDEALVRTREEEIRRMQADSNQRLFVDHLSNSVPVVPIPSASSATSTPSKRPARYAPCGSGDIRSGTPPVSRPMPPWRGPLHRPPPHEAAMAPSGGPLRPSGRLARNAATVDSSFHAGRSTPRAPPSRAKSGAESVPAGKGTPRAPPCSAIGGGNRNTSGCRVQAPCCDADAPASARTGRAQSPLARATSPEQALACARRQATSSSPPRCREGSATPPAPRSGSPARSEKDLPPSWKRLVESAYRDETGRPIADRICLSDFTSAHNSKSETLFWVNARVRWGDLIITESGRVPQRGEDLVLFVLHGPASAPRAASPRRAAPCVSLPSPRHGRRPSSPQRKDTRSWRVGSCRIIRHLPFTESGDMCLAAEIGRTVFKTMLAGVLFPETAATEKSSYSYVVHPPQTCEPQVRSHQNPASPNPPPGSGSVSPRPRKQPIFQGSAPKR
eukprot:TRINITY_DN57990_c0_g1_i1.p1 TRINITY_DN57990_c0_g1~~TRINITY_DN57990_c0_g1_i1.p1  ORF type:complete len:655 (-),score=59.75 TRINITY_DN57990_c0_g1_i1:460-2286(-)